MIDTIIECGFRDSDVDWIGPVPNDWPVAPVSRKYQLNLGKMINGGNAQDSDGTLVPYLRAANVQPDGLWLDEIKFLSATPRELMQLSLRAGDLVVVEGGAGFGRSAVLNRSLDGWIFQNHIIRLRSIGDGEPRFLDYCIKASLARGYIATLSNHATIPSLSSEKLAHMLVPMPPRSDQVAIANFLDRETVQIDALIGKQKALLELLAERRKAVITRAVTKGLDIAGGSSKDWSVVPLKRVIKGWASGTSVNAANTPAEAGEVGVLKTSCVSAGQFDPSQNKVVVAEEVDRVTCPVRRNTLIVNRANTPALVGSAGLVREAPANLFLSDKLWQIEFGGATASFIYYWTVTELYRSQLSAIRVGASASMQNISFGDFSALVVTLPSITDQDRITKHLDGQVATIDALAQKARDFISVARERRAALITAAVTGKIDVREQS